MIIPWLLVANLGNRVLTVATQLLVGFLLVPEQVGLFAVASGLAIMATPFQSGDLGRIALQDHVDPHGTAARITSWLLVGALAGGLLAVGAAAIPALGLGVALAPLACLAALAVPRVLGNVRIALLARAGRSRALAGASACEGLARSVVVVGGAWLGAGAWSLVMGEAAAALASLGLVFALHPGPAPGPFRLGRPIAKMLGAALGICLLVGIGLSCSAVAIGRLCSTADAGNYSFANRIAAQLTVLLLPLITLEAIPRLIATRGRRDEFAAVSRREIRRLLMLIGPLVAILMVAGPLAMELVWHDKWRDAGTMLRWLGVATGLRLAFALAKGHLEALGAFRAILVLTALDTAMILVAVLGAGTSGNALVVVLALGGAAALALGRAMWAVRRSLRAPHAAPAPLHTATAGTTSAASVGPSAPPFMGDSGR